MGMELRGDVIRILEACGAFGSTQPPPSGSQSNGCTATASHTAGCSADVRARDSSGCGRGRGSGIGAAPCAASRLFDDVAYFVLPANLQPGKRTGRGSYLVLNRDPQPSDDGRIARVAITQELWTADCVKNTISWLQSSYFDEADAARRSGPAVAGAPERRPVGQDAQRGHAEPAFRTALRTRRDGLKIWTPPTSGKSFGLRNPRRPPRRHRLPRNHSRCCAVRDRDPARTAPWPRADTTHADRPGDVAPCASPRRPGPTRLSARSIAARTGSRTCRKNRIARSVSIPGANCSNSRSPRQTLYYAMQLAADLVEGGCRAVRGHGRGP